MKKRKTPPLSPGRKLFLLAWTTLVVCFAFVILAKASFQIRIAGVILAGVIGGVLVGLKLLRKVDDLLVAMGLASPAGVAGSGQPGLEDVLGLLRQYRKKGQFSTHEYARWCHEAGFPKEKLLRVMLDKGWVLERESALLITSKGEELLAKSM